ncbi:DUF523 domain-containing protein [Pseudoalteromonas piscicida]|uniref:Uncharacterized protein n=1 Tax=Pseudoalteromonas piscicida TaxID=43662 RepID=A0A2A5JKL5_PSEO7|nr:DUF523 domain-containing protein [Pseudoalteromonas piscicida]PCK29988.1 hypothetical protein CEX98_20165 [Pseudoalteromonas piscicida]
MFKILVSSCLLGYPVRYDASSQSLQDNTLLYWRQKNWVLPFCPEVAGGLPTPRPPAEITDGKILSQHGEDFTEAFMFGAQKAQALCVEHNIQFALLKESSPSCGSNFIYDGSHSGKKIAGEGVTAALLRLSGIQVFSETELPALVAAMTADDIELC